MSRGIVASIVDCYPGGPGSIPGRGSEKFVSFFSPFSNLPETSGNVIMIPGVPGGPKHFSEVVEAPQFLKS